MFYNSGFFFLSFQPMQLRHVRRLSKTRSARLGKWPKCSRCSGSHGVCDHERGIVRGASVRQPYQVSVSSTLRVQRSSLTCLSVGVFLAERRAKMCWRLRAWRPLACCRAEYSLEADRRCRAVSTRHRSSPAFTPSCLVGFFIAVSVLLGSHPSPPPPLTLLQISAERWDLSLTFGAIFVYYWCNAARQENNP